MDDSKLKPGVKEFTFKDGSRYVGFFRDKIKEGKGIFYYN